MRLWELEQFLQDNVGGFKKPVVEYEQYLTPPTIAAQWLYTVHTSLTPFDGCSVLDLGCGTGMLSIGAAALGASQVYGIDIDPKALAIASQNVEEAELADVIDLLNADVSRMIEVEYDDSSSEGSDGDESSESDEDIEYEEAFPFRTTKFVDIALTNPPFGTRQKGIDMLFLQYAFKVARTAVYSLHKTSTREHILKKAEQWGIPVKVVAELRYNLEQSYKFHKKKSVDIAVDLMYFDLSKMA